MNHQAPNTQALPAGTRLEEFVIERVLGAGGFGITYLARDVSLGRQVVIKENLPVQFCFRDPRSLTVSPRHTSGEDLDNFQWSLENFSRESAMLASVDHPGIVKVLRSFQAFGTAYFVMPFVEGMALDELAKKRNEQSFTEEELASLLKETLSALGYLHDRGIYHRDIKPGNILITSEGKPVLIDFGSARQRLSERSMTVVESAGYTPFEQLQSRGNIGPWSDLYALGATLEKILTGEAPPKAADRFMGDPRKILSRDPKCYGFYAEPFLSAIDKALSVNPEQRWQSGYEWLCGMSVSPLIEEPVIIPVQEWQPKGVSVPPPIEIPVISTSVAVIRESIQPNYANSKQQLGRLQRVKPPSGKSSWRASNKLIVDACGFAAVFLAVLVIGNLVYSNGDNLKDLKVVEEREFEIAPGVQMTFCWCPPGEFMMGSPKGEAGRDNDEVQHRVKLTKGFWMGKYEVTQKQWTAVLGTNPSHFKGDNLPVEKVSWNDVQRFLGELNAKIGNTDGGQMALPTEAQWEYACRAGEQGPYSGGTIDEVAWYDDNSGGETHSVGKKKPNAWGLYDMHGNVMEWCADRYGEYPEGLLTDPSGPLMGSYRVGRPGCWVLDASGCRAADRDYYTPSLTFRGLGFRVARSSVP
jgi:formylglycine-generating enzyme required for sulfatase activity